MPASAFRYTGSVATSVLPSPVFISAILPLVQHHAADQLHVEVAHVHGALACLAHHGKGLGQNLVQRLGLRGLALVFVVRRIGNVFHPLGEARLELGGLLAQLGVGERLNLRLPFADGRHRGHHALDDTLVVAYRKSW